MTSSQHEISLRRLIANTAMGFLTALSLLMLPVAAHANDSKWWEYARPITSPTIDGKLEFPSRVVLSYPQDDITLTLDLTGYYKVKRFEVTVRANRFLIPENACEKFGVRIEHLHVVRHSGEYESGEPYFQIKLYGNQTIGEERSVVGNVSYEIVPTCEVNFDGNGFRTSRMSTSAASDLAPPRDQSRKWGRTPEE